MQLGFHFDQTRCTGCEACVVACKDWKDLPAGPAALLRIVPVEEGRFPALSLRFFPLACFHCARPVCVEECPTEALRKRPEDGVVVVDGELCLIGCRLCADACPYQAPQFASGGTARLCDLCADRRGPAQPPVCVAACPQRALDVAPLEKLQNRYNGDSRLRGFPDPGRTGPAILLRGKHAVWGGLDVNGVHDLGGMHGLGRVQREKDEPVFHAEWERNVFGISYVLGRAAGLLTTDEGRFARESMPPLHYLAARYYERSLYAMTRNLVQKGVITEEELDARAQLFRSSPGTRPPRTESPGLLEMVEQRMLRGRRSTERQVAEQPRFRVDDPVMTRNINPKGHTRLPRYARGKHAVIARLHGAFIFPDTYAHGLGENPQYVYSVRFDGQELWGAEAEPNTVVYLDLWESYLTPG